MGAGLTSGLPGVSQEELTIWSGPYMVILIWGYPPPPLQHGPRKFLKKPGTRELAVSTSGRQLVRRTVQDPAAAQ
jgi:hypothetical protein